ncbi:penicillin-binding protein [Fictibacillus macauensis ZFHKF-1]|uniref:Penicillin-binding protein n=2 Tax=Fictibacillus TaxID=1329200 RepID=I8U9T7_9BACL|nr:PBP1A family penicillin-binding protein [Fictibacillus macauensis]EIT83720.1 penicillin-binding protein [Fictibacillus macauensis ZFHKF-1]
MPRMRRWKKKTRLQKMLFLSKGIGILVGFFVIITGGLLLTAKLMGPPPILTPQTTMLYANNGEELGEMAHSGQKRSWIPLRKMSPALIQATIAVEDKNFYEHHGFDFKRIAGAILADIKAGSKVQGASTISQQFARNLFLTHDKTWTRKFMEAFYTLRLEMNYSKNEILEGYLNTIYYGHGTYGVQSASSFYFGKDARSLTVGEASLLAGVPKGPGYYSPLLNEERAKQRQKIILQAMENNHYLTQQEAVTAAAQPITILNKKEEQQASLAPYFQAEVMRQLKNELKLDPKQIELGGLHVYTTLDPAMQHAAEKEVAERTADNPTIQTALVSMNPENGEVKAWVGGKNYKQSSFDRASQALRAPGSTFKPFLYYAALKNGYTPSTELKSERTAFTMGTGTPPYKPKNYNDVYANDFITLAEAIAVSDNIYAVKTNLFLGPNKLVQTARQFGITSPLAKVPSLALGTNGVSLLEMVNAYNMFPNGGQHVKPTFIKKITDHNGQTLYEAKNEHKQILDPAITFVMTDLMRGMFDERLNGYTKVTGASIDQLLSRPAAGKSGSTPTDSWMIGFTPQLTTGVWIGYDQGKELDSINDGSYSKKIWANYMESALKNVKADNFKKPAGVVSAVINPANGKLAGNSCPVTMRQYYVKGTEPKETCNEHAGDTIAPKKEKKNWWQKLFSW